jgi:hypothetical protein
LFNNDKEREQKKAKMNTMSIWTDILNNINIYKNTFYEPRTILEYFFTPIFPFSRVRMWEEFFFPFTQININISYDKYINKFSNNYYFDIFGKLKQKKRILSNIMFIGREKNEYEQNLEKIRKENEKLRFALAELTINNDTSKEAFDNLSKESKVILNSIAKEYDGEFVLNQEQDKYIYKGTKKPVKPKEEKIINLEEKKENQKIETKVENENEVLKIDDIIASKNINKKNNENKNIENNVNLDRKEDEEKNINNNDEENENLLNTKTF